MLTILTDHPDEGHSPRAATAMLWRDPPSSNVVGAYIGYCAAN